MVLLATLHSEPPVARQVSQIAEINSHLRNMPEEMRSIMRISAVDACVFKRLEMNSGSYLLTATSALQSDKYKNRCACNDGPRTLSSGQGKSCWHTTEIHSSYASKSIFVIAYAD